MSETSNPKRGTREPSPAFDRRIVVVVIASILVIGVSVFLAIRLLGPDTAKIAAATDGLGAAAEGITLNDELSQIGSDLASRPGRSVGRRIDRAQTDIRNLTDQVESNPELGPALVKASRASADAANSLRALDEELNRANAELGSAGRRDARSLDRSARTLGEGRDRRDFIKSLHRAFRLYQEAIDEAEALLTDEDALTDEDLSRLLASREAITRQIPVIGMIGKELARSIDRTRARLVARSYDLRSVDGPAECGISDAGSTVVISSGRMPCAEALQTANRYEGKGSAPGWSCEGKAITLSGFVTDGSTGSSCSRGNALVSFYDAEMAAEAERAAAAGPTSCGSQRLISSTGTPSDFPIEASGMSCSEATGIAQAHWGNGTASQTTVGDFVCEKKTVGWMPGQVAFECSGAGGKVTAYWRDMEGDAAGAEGWNP